MSLNSSKNLRVLGFGGGTAWESRSSYFIAKTAKLIAQYERHAVQESDTFTGCTFSITGRCSLTQEQVSELVTKHGGRFDMYLYTRATYVVADNIAASQEKNRTYISKKKSSSAKFCSAFYLQQCISKRCILSLTSDPRFEPREVAMARYKRGEYKGESLNIYLTFIKENKLAPEKIVFLSIGSKLYNSSTSDIVQELITKSRANPVSKEKSNSVKRSISNEEMAKDMRIWYNFIYYCYNRKNMVYKPQQIDKVLIKSPVISRKVLVTIGILRRSHVPTAFLAALADLGIIFKNNILFSLSGHRGADLAINLSTNTSSRQINLSQTRVYSASNLWAQVLKHLRGASGTYRMYLILIPISSDAYNIFKADQYIVEHDCKKAIALVMKCFRKICIKYFSSNITSYDIIERIDNISSTADKLLSIDDITIEFNNIFSLPNQIERIKNDLKNQENNKILKILYSINYDKRDPKKCHNDTQTWEQIYIEYQDLLEPLFKKSQEKIDYLINCWTVEDTKKRLYSVNDLENKSPVQKNNYESQAFIFKGYFVVCRPSDSDVFRLNVQELHIDHHTGEKATNFITPKFTLSWSCPKCFLDALRFCSSINIESCNWVNRKIVSSFYFINETPYISVIFIMAKLAIIFENMTNYETYLVGKQNSIEVKWTEFLIKSGELAHEHWIKSLLSIYQVIPDELCLNLIKYFLNNKSYLDLEE